MLSGILLGGIGNQLFIMAAIISHSLKTGVPYCIPMKVSTPHYDGQSPYIFPGVNYCDEKPSLPLYGEAFFHYTEIAHLENANFSGYFQSYLYHHGYKKEILKCFGFDGIEIKQGEVFLHIRLGDYRHLQKFHKIVDEEYLIQSLRFFATKGYRKFLVFSDEINEAKKMLNNNKFKYLEFEYSEENDELTDLKLMASCQHGIMSASSFSWWGAYIGQNEDRMIIYPRNWFGESLSYHNTKDLCPENWMAL